MLRLCSDSAQLATVSRDSGFCTYSAYLKLTLPQTPDSARDSATHSTQTLFRLYTDCITQTVQTLHRLYQTETLRQTLLILNYIRFIDTLLSLSQQYIRVPGSHTCPLSLRDSSLVDNKCYLIIVKIKRHV